MACRDAVARTFISKTDFVWNLPIALPQALAASAPAKDLLRRCRSENLSALKAESIVKKTQ